MSNITGGSTHHPQDTSEPGTFKIQILPAGSAPKSLVHQPDVNGELAPGQPNNTADAIYGMTTEGTRTDVHKGLGSDLEDKGRKEKEEDRTTQEGHRAEIKSASERVPESASSI